MEINHKYTSSIVCPYCGFEDGDSWELDSDGEDDYQCGSCEKEFSYERDISITYTTTKKECEDCDMVHQYLFISKLEDDRTKKYRDRKELPESEWKYYDKKQCSVCDKEELYKITKEEHDKIRDDGA